MMERESSEEEEDQENLISQNTQPNDNGKSPNHRQSSPFHIEDDSRSSFSGTARKCKKSNGKQPGCFYPVPQAAECINRVVEMAGVPIVYLSTDAAESETGLLKSLVAWNEKTIPLVQRPSRNSAEKWDALLYRHGLDGESQVEAMLDKTICAMSSVFVGSSGSTFTEDILRLRKDWGLASVCDEYLCQGEVPNFIAEDE